MDAKQIRKLRPMLKKYLGEFDDCFSRSEPAQNMRVYVTGQLSDLQRKSIEPMADRAGVPPRTLQQFLSLAAWDDVLMANRLAQIVARDHGHRMSIGTIDETSDPKKGDKTPGVQRQYCGASGKVDNCVTSVHLGYSAGDFHTLLGGELFLPEAWSRDRQRCREAGIPDSMVHRPKWRIAIELWDQAVSNGVRMEWLTADEGYGEVPEFHFAMDDRGQRYALEVPSIFRGWLQPPAILQKQHHLPGKLGRPKRYPRLKSKNLPTVEVRNMVRYCKPFSDQAWQRFHVKDTTKGPEVWDVKMAPIYLKRDGLPTWPHWLLVARNVLRPDEIKYFISNAPKGTPPEVLLHVAFSRYQVERCFEEEKGELGMDHFEVRNYTSLKRHLVLTAVSHLFLAKAHERWRGKKSASDGMPNPPGCRGNGAFAVAHRTDSQPVYRERGQHHPPNAGTNWQGTTKPHQNTHAEAA